MLGSVQEQGRLIAEGLRLTLEQLPGTSVPAARRLFERMGTRDIRVKLLYRAGVVGGPDSFFFVASSTPTPAQDLEREQQELVKTGVINQLPGSCEGGEPLALYYKTPSGSEELLISVSAIRAVSGCWVVVSSLSLDELKGSWIGRPYWQTAEV